MPPLRAFCGAGAGSGTGDGASPRLSRGRAGSPFLSLHLSLSMYLSLALHVSISRSRSLCPPLSLPLSRSLVPSCAIFLSLALSLPPALSRETSRHASDPQPLSTLPIPTPSTSNPRRTKTSQRVASYEPCTQSLCFPLTFPACLLCLFPHSTRITHN